MPDGTLAAIDRFFDFVDQGVEHVDRVLNRSKQTTDLPRNRKARRSEVIDTEATPKPSKKEERRSPPASTMALARKSRFYIVEAVDGGTTRFVVTDGGNARATCGTRAFAEQLLQALEKAP